MARKRTAHKQAERQSDIDKQLDPSAVYFLPLGGSEQFGVNFNLYAHDGAWLAVDCGLGFADHNFPGVDLLLPDPAFAAERADKLAGLIITHAHEDHIGAVAYLWPRLKCPVYCTPFTASVLRRKIEERPESRAMKIHVIAPGKSVQIGPFNTKFIHVSHSIPNTCALLVETAGGNVLHSGDWNLDPSPVLDGCTDEAALREAGERGVMAYIGDSTNAQVAGRSSSEQEVAAGLEALFHECKGRICVTAFASNIARIHSIYQAAKACGREVGLVGRSLFSMTTAARDCGYLQDVKGFVREDEIDNVPADKIVIIATGSQGEARAALARIARAEHPNVSLQRGDTVIFSARAIPGNEKEIDHVKNNLIAGGVRVIGTNDTHHLIHVSGHPRRDEIVDMLGWLRPQLVVPVHGERQQLEAHADIARSCQIPHVIVPNNGSLIRLGPGVPEVVHHVETGLLAVEPKRLIPANHEAIASRRKLQYTGAVHVTLVMTDSGELLADPKVTTVGLTEKKDENFITALMDEVEDIIDDMDRFDLREDHAVHEEVRIGMRRMIDGLFGIKPNVSVHVVRLED